jgi:hypothetical protein
MSHRCALCFTDRTFAHFAQLFRHVTHFHQHDLSFRFSCELGDRCGIIYKTFASYKGHVYRHHKEEQTGYHSFAHRPKTPDDLDFFSHTTSSTTSHDDRSDEEPVDEIDDEELANNDISSFLTAPITLESISLARVQKSYARFLLQLREEFIWPKRVIQRITSKVVTLLENVFRLVEHEQII